MQHWNDPDQRAAASPEGGDGGLPSSAPDLQRLFDASPMGMTVVRADGSFRYANDRMLAMLGVDREQFLRSKARDYYVDPAQRDVILRRLAEAGRLQDVEIELKRSDGSPFSALISFSPTGSEDDPAYFGWVYDISDRKAIEHDLARNQKRLMMILESCPTGVAITEPQSGRFMFVNARFMELFRLTPAHIAQETSVDLYANREDRDRLLAKAQEQGYLVDEEVLGRRSDGSVVWVLLSLRPFVYEGQPAALGWVHDIDDRKHAEDALRRSEERFRGIIEGLKDDYVFYSYDRDLRVTYVSPSVARVLGYGREELGIQIADVLTDSPLNADVLASIRASLAGERMPPYLNEVRHKDGSTRLVETLDVPVHDADGNVIGANGIARDITEQRRAQMELAEAKDRAETALAELKRVQANLIQAEKMASLGQLTAGIAHEIKNPLNFVNNFAETSVELLDELQQALTPAIAAMDESGRSEVEDLLRDLTTDLQSVAKHGRRADGIVKTMLMHARAEGAERTTIDLNDLVDEALNLTYHAERARDRSFQIALERNLAPGIGPVELVAQDITRVLVNLFTNGLYATKARKEASGADYSPQLSVNTADLGDEVQIRVRDNGTGVPAAARNRLFEPFFTTKPTGEGTGLGLSLSYDIIVNGHDGAISVDSAPGAFTEFVVTLPKHASRKTG